MFVELASYLVNSKVCAMVIPTFFSVSLMTSPPEIVNSVSVSSANTILFEAVPYDGETLHLEVIQPLSEILPVAGLTEIINLPPGYERALIYNLCLELAPEYGKEPTALIATQAVQAKLKLKRNNYRSLVLGMDRALATQRKGIGSYIIESGP